MANQTEPGTMGGPPPVSTAHQASMGTAASAGIAAAHGQPGGLALNEASGGAAAHPSFHGRPVSWVAVSIVMAGFVVGGLAMMVGHHGPVWWLFWVGAAMAVVGMLVAVTTNTFEDWY